MKRNLMNVLAIGTLATGLMMAQQGPHRGPGGTPPDPATMVAHQVERLTDQLTLTAAQQAQANTIFTNAATALTPLRSNLQTAHTSLGTAIQKGDTASIDNLSSQIGSLTGQEVDVQSKAQAAFYKILTADQQTKLGTSHGGFGGLGGMGRGPAGQGFSGGRSRQ